MSQTTSTDTSGQHLDLPAEVARRRTFAVISHPDAGKSTLTEALALHARIINEAGAVHGKSGRKSTVSDWMEMEKARGISVSSTALQFTYSPEGHPADAEPYVINLVDTPGHADFSEDTYRVLTAVDAAVMLIDAAKGLEPQTLKLFQVCKHRGIPIITVINKWDRPGRAPLELLDEIAEQIGLVPTPLYMPVGIAGDYRGLLRRGEDGEPVEYIHFIRTAGGSTIAAEEHYVPEAAAEREGEAWTTAVEESQLLSAMGQDHDQELYLAGETSPVIFASAMLNFGVHQILDALVELAPAPGGRETVGGDRRATGDPFSAAIRGPGRGTLHGRGACDMKAGVAANAAVVRTLTQNGVKLQRPLAVHTVISEEDGGLGALAAVVRGHTGDACVIGEPTGGRLITANAGALTFEIVVDGLAAHGSTRLSGHSAFEAFLPIYAALQDLERSRNQVIDPLFQGNSLPYGISVGRIETGDWASSVPDRLVAEGRLGVILGEEMPAARAAFESAVEAAAERDPWLRDHRPRVTWPGGQFASGRLSDDDPLISQMADAAWATHGTRPDRAAAPYGSDLRLMLGLGGIPTLQYGPGAPEDAHAPRERVEIEETLDVARSLLVLTLRRCGVA